MSFGDFCGWACAIIWGAAYYPTLLLNCRVKSADSLSLDSVSLNLLGYLSYSSSVALQVYNEQVQSQFEQAYGTRPVLALSDLFYALHGVFVLLLLWSQCVLGHPLWGFQDRRRHRVHRVTQIILSLFIIFLVFNWFRRDLEFQLLSFSINLAYFKIGISCVKYIPQVIHNWKRKSMYGSSKAQIILDYTGSMFAVMEVLVKNDKPVLEAIALNRGKYGLIVISMIFDTIFTGQFYKYSSEDLKLPLKEKSVV